MGVGRARERGLTRLDAFLSRRYAQTHRYFELVIFTLAGVGALVSGLGFVIPVYAGAPLDSALRFTLGLQVLNLVAALCTYPFVRGWLSPLYRWMSGDRHAEEATAVWDATARAMPRAIATGIAIFLVVFSLAAPWGVHVLNLSWAAAPAIYLTCMVAVFVAASADALLWDFMMRPALRELDECLADGSATRRHAFSIRSQLRVMPTMSMWGAPIIAASVSGVDVAPMTRLLIVIITSLVVALTFGNVVHSLTARVVLEPMAELEAAFERVRRGDLTVRLPAVSMDEFGDLAIAFNDMQRGLRERASLHAAFGSYVDPALAQRLLESGSSMFEGEDLDLTVMFADVRSFTTYSEGVSPADAVQLLNRLFDVMVPVIHRHGGHANHYLGDGLLAVFGAPQPLPAHADAAVSAAIEIQKRVRAEMGDELRIGIGINTGSVIAGTVGGGGRLEFTVIGDTVNAAARVEALTKDTGDLILITEATRRALSRPRPRSTKRGDFEVRGKATKLTLHAVNPFPRTTQRSTR